MTSSSRYTAAQRDRAVERMRRLTAGIALGGVASMAAVALAAAAARHPSTTSSALPADTGTYALDDDGALVPAQGVAQGTGVAPAAGGRGGGQVATGGS